MIEQSPAAEVEVGTLTHNLFAAGPLIEGDQGRSRPASERMTSSVISPFHSEQGRTS
jgi:hypothetical protein